MVAVTYDVAAPAVADTKTATNSKGFFTIVLEAIAESQTKRAERELARYRHLLPHDFALQRDRLLARNEDEPFGGW
jgi:hypothetical protein